MGMMVRCIQWMRLGRRAWADAVYHTWSRFRWSRVFKWLQRQTKCAPSRYTTGTHSFAHRGVNIFVSVFAAACYRNCEKQSRIIATVILAIVVQLNHGMSMLK